MRKLNDAIDRFCATHPRWGIPGLMRYIVIANVALYVLGLFAGSGTLDFLSMNTYAVLHGEIWRLVTYVLMPAYTGLMNGFWLAISLFFYYWLGTSLEGMWGSAKFTMYYVGGTLLTSLAMVVVALITGGAYTLTGATYVNLAMFLAYAMTNPDAQVLLLFIIPIKMKWLAWVEGGLIALNVLLSLVQGNLAGVVVPIAALLNFFVFFSPDFHQRTQSFQARRRPQAIQFRKAVKDQQRHKGYTHQCSVCGKTDADYPNMQFRYCSKCQGYHCFCEEHIFNHVHFTE